MEGLAPRDSIFLSVENEFNHMSTAILALFDGPPPGEADIGKMIASKLHFLPGLRFAPLQAATPVWCDDPHFNLRYRLRYTALPAPGSMERLQAKTLATRNTTRSLELHHQFLPGDIMLTTSVLVPPALFYAEASSTA